VKIDLGCGRNKREGYLGVDLVSDADVQMDILSFLRTLEVDSVDAVRANHSLEHLPKDVFLESMLEILRVCRPGAIIEIALPYFSQAVNAGNPYHHTLFSEHTFRFFCRQKADTHGVLDGHDWIRPHSFGLWGDQNEGDLPGYIVITSLTFHYHPDFADKSDAEKEYARLHYLNAVLDMEIVLQVEK
jgi:SAM-dependent methyltransferase